MIPNRKRKIPIVSPDMSGLGEDRKFNSIQLNITTHCDRMCPGCVVNIPYIKHSHMSVETIKKIASKVKGIRMLQISGGEPTMHPRFKYIVEHMREWFKPKMTMLITNGYGLMDCIDYVGLFDHIRISYYTENSYPKSKSNLHLIEEFKENFKGHSRVYHKPSKHRLNRANKNTNPCGLGANDLAQIQGNRIYPCCASIMTGHKGIKITKNWREELKNTPLGCEKCAFSPSDELYKAWQEGEITEELKQELADQEDDVHKRIKKQGYKQWVKGNL